MKKFRELFETFFNIFLFVNSMKICVQLKQYSSDIPNVTCEGGEKVSKQKMQCSKMILIATKDSKC